MSYFADEHYGGPTRRYCEHHSRKHSQHQQICHWRVSRTPFLFANNVSQHVLAGNSSIRPRSVREDTVKSAGSASSLRSLFLPLSASSLVSRFRRMSARAVTTTATTTTRTAHNCVSVIFASQKKGSSHTSYTLYLEPLFLLLLLPMCIIMAMGRFSTFSPLLSFASFFHPSLLRRYWWLSTRILRLSYFRSLE